MDTILYIKISYFKYSIKSLDITGKSEMRMNLVLIIHKNQFLGIEQPIAKIVLKLWLGHFLIRNHIVYKNKGQNMKSLPT